MATVTTSPTKQPLAERSVNTTSPSKSPTKTDILKKDTMYETGLDKPPFLSQHSTIPSETTSTAYVSPSDTIMSPTTKKLSQIRGKRFASAKPQSLFAKTLAKEGRKSQEKMDKNTDA